MNRDCEPIWRVLVGEPNALQLKAPLLEVAIVHARAYIPQKRHIRARDRLDSAERARDREAPEVEMETLAGGFDVGFFERPQGEDPVELLGF